jgi:uncharacterized protein YjiS (DUF1127 family)
MSAQTMTHVSLLRPLSLLAHLRIRPAIAAVRRAWHEAARAAASRRNLRQMDDRMLSDIGISRAQADFEAYRWR